MWRGVLGAIMLATVVYTLVTLNRSARALTTAGDQQDQFVAALQTSLNKDTLPELQSAGAETISEAQPQLRASFDKLGPRIPEVTAVAKGEFQSLEKDLPAKSEAILNQSFETVLTEKEGSIRKMYPELTDEQVKNLVENLTEEGRTEATEANQELFAAHEERLKGIMNNLELIKDQEAKNVKGVEPSWDMAILLLDILREDIKNQAPVATGPNNSDKASPLKPAPGAKV